MASINDIKIKVGFKFIERFIIYGLIALLAIGLGYQHLKHEKDIGEVRADISEAKTIALAAMDLQKKPTFNTTGLKPTADGMIMDNGAINYDALVLALKTDETLINGFLNRIPKQEIFPTIGASTGLSEKEVRIIASGVYKYYWRHAEKLAGDLPPWDLINY